MPKPASSSPHPGLEPDGRSHRRTAQGQREDSSRAGFDRQTLRPEGAEAPAAGRRRNRIDLGGDRRRLGGTRGSYRVERSGDFAQNRSAGLGGYGGGSGRDM